MAKLNIEVNNYSLAPGFAGQIWAGSAFAFIGSGQTEDDLQAGFNNFYGNSPTIARRTLPLWPDGQIFPGFKVKPVTRPLKLAPALLTDKEIYKAGQDAVRLLLVAPDWVIGESQQTERKARLVIENNGAIYRTQPVKLEEDGLTLVDLGKLPEGSYRVYWDGEEAADYQGDKAECRFSSVEYVLSPLQATLLAHQLDGKQLSCRLKVERFNEPLNAPIEIELWSGPRRLAQQKVKPGTPGIYNTDFKVKTNATERLELRVNYLDQVATAVIPGSEKAERDETLLSGLGREVRASLMPREGAREVRGLYLSEDSAVKNTPVSIFDPAPPSGKARLRWQVDAQAARVLVLDLHSEVIENRDLGTVSAGQEFELDIPTPGAFLAVGGWLDGKAWEGWAVTLVPSPSRLDIQAPATARPGKPVEIKLATDGPASVYVLVRDSRLAGARPTDRLAASIKRGLEGVNKWGTLGYVKQTLMQHPDWPEDTSYYVRRMNTGSLPPFPQSAAMPMQPFAAPPPSPMSAPAGMPSMQMKASAPMNFASRERMAPPTGASADMLFQETASFGMAGAGQAEATAEPRRDFADVAYCGIVKTGASGETTLTFQLPDAITSYSIEAFALGAGGKDWYAAHESLEVTQPVWAEFKLPAFVYPGDKSPASLEIGCKGGLFRLRLLRDGIALPYTLSGARQTAPDTFSGTRAKIVFEAQPGLWRVELEDLNSQERDISERTVMALGQFKGLARRFQLLLAGQTISKQASGALQLRLLPSLDKPFMVLCDATTDYGHRCCEQTAAKLLAAVAALVAGSEPVKLREVILAGVARERKMFLPGQGFMMYPPEESGGNRTPNDYWGKKAAEHLLGLALVGQSLFAPGANQLDSEVKQALEAVMQMGEQAASAYQLPTVPTTIHNGQDAYRAVAKNASLRGEALSYARRSLQETAAANQGAVLAREEQAYCAAALLLSGEPSAIGLAIEAANRLASNLDSEGRLYSTVDSVALISLMGALKTAGIGAGGAGKVRLDSQELALAEALEVAASGQTNEITVLEGAALVELTTEVVEDWKAFRAQLPVSVELRRIGRPEKRALRLGDMLELVVKLDKYEPGQLVHVCLPSAISRIEGGGEVKKFSVDFCGRNELRIPLRATGYTLKEGEHWAVLVRNMFNEEQAGNPGLLLAQVSPE